MYELVQHQKERNLVSVSRSGIDNYSIEAFVLGVSDELVLLQYVYDFNLDGLMVLRIADITEVRCSDTCKFQRELLEHEGLIQQIPFDMSLDLRNWKTLLAQLSTMYPLMILECEKLDDPDYIIGQVEEVRTTAVAMQWFSGTGRWDDELASLALEDITSCQVGTNYISFYQRYFERTAHRP
ncbi:hypothetical protein F2P45_24125 [Massilia sp. CCM 8733]|uniref:Uncharacterized protein n=1 Tax=Massilia mucilaginosa TaxID=2609282 RepID=A0ABX0NZ64_9BURK|nr:hypothetical protein [Massilia mucilaginosa]NHZ92069.1 hypothetical protein [Massilia mucilaginosa]